MLDHTLPQAAVWTPQLKQARANAGTVDELESESVVKG